MYKKISLNSLTDTHLKHSTIHSEKSLVNIVNIFVKITILSRKATTDCKNSKDYHILYSKFYNRV